MEPLLTVTEKGFIIQDSLGSYVLQWAGERLHVHGPDVCYYLVETLAGLEKMNCLAATSTLLVSN